MGEIKLSKKCAICSKDFFKRYGMGKRRWDLQRFCSIDCRKIFLNSQGSKSIFWKNNIGYSRVHGWLRKEYGSANKCENIDCENGSKIFEWAKKKDKMYERKRENFLMLCRSCHRKYDMTEEKKLQAIKNLNWFVL